MLSNLLKTKKHYLLFFSCATLIVSLTWLPYLQIMFHAISFGDEGIVAQSAYRVLNGEVPYRDFFSALTPGVFYWTAFFMKCFGPTFLAVRISLIATNMLLLLIVCLIAYQYKVRSIGIYAAILSFLAYFGGPYWFIASHHWTALAFCLASFSLLIHALDKEQKPKYLLLAGILAALSTFTMQHMGGVWIVGATLALLCDKSFGRVKAVLLFWGGIVAFTLPVTLVFISVAGLDVLIYDLITFPLTRYHNMQGHSGAVFEHLQNIWNGLFLALPYGNSIEGYLRIVSGWFSFAGICVVYTLPLLGIIALRFLWKTEARLQHIAILIAFFSSQYITALNRLADTTLVFAAPSALIVLAVTVDRMNKQNDRWRTFAAWSKKVWIVLFTGIAISGSLFHAIAQKAATVTPAGTVYSLYAGEQQTLQGLKRFFRSKKPDETVFIRPYAPMLYYLFHVKNPTPYDTLTPPMHSQAQLDEVQEILESTKCRWVINTAKFEDDSFTQYLKDNFILNNDMKYAAVLERKPTVK